MRYSFQEERFAKRCLAEYGMIDGVTVKQQSLF
jgi:hypothetical protein